MTAVPTEPCALCGRVGVKLTRHHLIPRTLHRNRAVRKRYGKAEPRERIAMLCPPCHKMVHAVLTEKQMAREYSTLESLAAHPEIGRFVEWVRKQAAGKRVQVRRPKERGRSG